MKSFEDWLNMRYRPGTTARYLREQRHFGERYDAVKANREECLEWIAGLRKQGYGRGSLISSLSGLKAWFFYLLDTDQREDHPCRFVKLKDKRVDDVQLQDLFSTEELEMLLDRKERYGLLKNRNLMIVGLLIYQGLTTGECVRLKTEDLDLSVSSITVSGTSRTRGRRLALKPQQVLPIHRYLTEDRPQLLGDRASDQLLITKVGFDENGEGISYLLEQHQALFPSRKLNPKTVRQSVIANWLSAGIDLRKVQYMAGHKYPSSTERYRQSQVEKLKELIEKYHPLG